MRGRLIYKFLAEIARIDYDATAADPDGAGALTSGFNHLMSEPRLLPGRVKARQEQALIKVPCQVAPKVKQEILDMGAGGNSPDSKFVVYVHFKWLEQNSLLDASGDPLFRVNDRLNAIYDKWGNLIRTVRNPPGLFLTEVQSRAFGLGSKRNLARLTFQERARAPVKVLEEE
jgi:hypothetical protein